MSPNQLSERSSIKKRFTSRIKGSVLVTSKPCFRRNSSSQHQKWTFKRSIQSLFLAHTMINNRFLNVELVWIASALISKAYRIFANATRPKATLASKTKVRFQVFTTLHNHHKENCFRLYPMTIYHIFRYLLMKKWTDRFRGHLHQWVGHISMDLMRTYLTFQLMRQEDNQSWRISAGLH